MKEFEAKIQQKEAEMVKEIENYERKNSSLVMRVAELETELLSLKNWGTEVCLLIHGHHKIEFYNIFYNVIYRKLNF